MFLGYRAFLVAGPPEWNKLPAKVNNTDSFGVFKKKVNDTPVPCRF